MTTRAKRMIKYLENELGWSVSETKLTCPNMHSNYSGNFCSECGEKLKKSTDKTVISDVEEAIKFALEEK